MKEVYKKLKELYENPEQDLWTETVIFGEKAGEKRLLTELGDREEQYVFRERVGRIPHLVICGGGHVAIAITEMGKMLGFTVTVLEDRPQFANHARKAGADFVRCDTFKHGLSTIKGNSDTWFVIVTRGHRYDTECLELILKKKYAYVGMMGSRRRVAIVKDQLEEKGVSRELLDEVHTPIGLKIGAETPEEIAVSVMAEIIEIKNKRVDSGGYSKEILNAIFERDNEQKKVLATIISRKGSAPRGVGTKMVIEENGKLTGTIGGGCIESEIIQKALLMMRKNEVSFQVCTVDMTAEAAENEGMVCGGVVKVMLEIV